MDKRYPTPREIIYLLGIGTLLVGSFFLPGLGYVAKDIASLKCKKDWEKAQKEWNKFNIYALKRNLKRLRSQKAIEVVEQDGHEVIKLTKKGRTKFLKFSLEELSLKGKTWDGKWRIVIYDIAKEKGQRNIFRNILKYINFYQLQKSVYLMPYPCEEQISYLREYYNVGDDVVLIRADKIENEEIYKKYFGL